MTPTPDFRALLADDAYAASFQSMGQYRTALLKALATPEPPEPLSPDAKAVMDAFLDSAVDAGNYYATRSHQIAAALRAAAMRTLLTSEHYEGSTPNDYELGWNAAVAYIQNIATELEGP